MGCHNVSLAFCRNSELNEYRLSLVGFEAAHVQGLTAE